MIAVNGLILILTSIFIGTYILAFFGISLPVVQVGGGLVVISTGWALLRQPDDEATGDKGAPRECSEADYSLFAFYPLTLPLTVGPGSISVAIAVGANRPEEFAGRLASDWRMVLGSMQLRGLPIYLSWFAERIGAHAGRLLDERDHPHFLLHSRLYRVQILWNGLGALLRTVIR